MSEKIRAVLIDDEFHALEMLEIHLQRNCPEVEILKLCEGPKAGLEAIRTLKPDLVFLDIEMPGMSGFDLIREIQPISFELIFVTAYDQFAIKAIKFSALDYLLKPVDPQELKAAVSRVQLKRVQLKKEPTADDRIEMLLKQVAAPEKVPDRIALPTFEGLQFVNVGDIITCNSDGNYTEVLLSDGRKLVISRSLKEMEKMLVAARFYRVHHSHVVNLNKIDRYVKGDGGYLVMTDGSSVNVSRSRKEGLLAVL